MADSYVCSGAKMRCTMGDAVATLTVQTPRTVYLCGQPMANISDHVSMANLAPFGLCSSLSFPDTARATAAHLGVLTPMPCIHNTPSPWVPGKADYLVKGQPALLKSSKCQCKWGGIISIIDDGQKEICPINDIQQKSVITPPQRAKKPDKVVLCDAYWEKRLEKDGKLQDEKTKLRFIPQLIPTVDLIIVYYYHYDNEQYSKDEAKIEIEIPGTCLSGTKQITLTNKKKLDGQIFKGHQLYLAKIKDFSFDLYNV